jgi:hypothetical protein
MGDDPTGDAAAVLRAQAGWGRGGLNGSVPATVAARDNAAIMADTPDGTDVPDQRGTRLRLAVPADAGPLLRLRQRLDQESSFMLLEPGERDTSPETLSRRPGPGGTVGELGGDRGGGLAGYVDLAGRGRSGATGQRRRRGSGSRWRPAAGGSAPGCCGRPGNGRPAMACTGWS